MQDTLPRIKRRRAHKDTLTRLSDCGYVPQILCYDGVV